MDIQALVVDCGKCIYCEDIDYLRCNIVICGKGGGCRVIPFCTGCSDFSEGRNKKRDISYRLDDYISSLTDDERKQIYKEIEDFCVRHIIPGENSVLWRWIESECRRASGESGEERPV